MSSNWRARAHFAPLSRLRSRIIPIVCAATAALAASSCGSDSTGPGGDGNGLRLSSIVIDGGSRTVEIGSVFTMTATVKDTAGKIVSVPLVWRSSADTILSFGPNGKATALDTGVVAVNASALGVTSGAVGVHVVWNGAANIKAFQFKPPLAVSPGVALPDSIRVAVTTLDSSRVAPGSLVRFDVTAGGGSLDSGKTTVFDTVGSSGIAAVKWTFGPKPAKNNVTAAVVGGDSLPIARVKGNPVTFTITTFAALAIVQGDSQTAAVLSPLPVIPSVRLVDSLGKPRAGVPITFTVAGNGRVANPVVSTAADGTASPGIWTLGDAEGDQTLTATVEAATVVLHATATGTTVRFAAAQVALAQGATCAVTADHFVSCMGQPPQIGGGDSATKTSTPTLTKGSVRLTSIAGGGAHFCGISTDLSIYCWGATALGDTLIGFGNASAPSRLQSNIAWLQVTPGNQHNCALANDQTAYCWGIDTTGQLGDNQLTRRVAPAPVAGGFKFTALAAGDAHECGIATNGALFCWGFNGSAQLGDGTSIQRRTPTAVSGNFKWKAIGAGSGWSCGLTDAGQAACWGAGTTNVSPATYAGSPTFTSLSVGAAHACALTSDGTAYCWGNNASGQLGDSTTTTRTVPTQVETTMRFASIAAGPQQTCGITLDGLLACWGRNDVGEIGLPTPQVQVTPRYVVITTKP